jgi:hypothetical protein
LADFLFVSALLVGAHSLTASSSSALVKSTAATLPQIQRVVIESNWWGLGDSQHFALTIVRRGDGGYTAGSKKVDSALIDRLVRALAAAPIAHVDPSTLGITEPWLKANAHKAFAELSRDDSMYRKHTPSQERFFYDEFTNIDVAENALRKDYRSTSFHTDDYPRVFVTITHLDGSTTTVESRAQQLYMLPWTVINAGKKVTTFNPELSTAIAAMPPTGACNRSRLDPGTDFRVALAQDVLDQSLDKWDSLGAADVLGSQLKPIEAVYVVSQSVIYTGLGSNSIDSISPIWGALLRDPNLPRNVLIDAFLPIRSGVPDNVGLFLEKIPAIVKQPMTVPWFTAYLSKHPQATAQITFALDRSVSVIAQNGFAKDMRSNGLPELSIDLQKQLNDSTLVELDEGNSTDDWSYWVVLPNKVMLPWYFRGSGSAGFSADQLHCVFGPFYYCDAMVLPDGVVVKRE